MKRTTRKSLFFLGGVVIALGLTAYGTFSATRELFASWTLPGFEATPFVPQIGEPTPTQPVGTPLPTFDLSQPLQRPSDPQVQIWDGNRRVTILLMGLEAHDDTDHAVPPRTDTMLLFTYDPGLNHVGMLSIPRDLWVAIPGYENGKINTAYQLGELYKVSEGGAGLAMATVEQLLGIPIGYYALVDFNLFARFIDEIEGVKINVPEMVRIAIIDGKNKPVFPGVQTMTGEVVLAYVRARTTPGGEFDRVQRQQLVLMGIRSRILELDLLTTLIAKAPLIYGEFSDGIRTNLTPNDIFKLAVALQGIPDTNIFSTTIGPDDVTFGTSPEGLEVLLPIPERIRIARDAVFPSEDPLSPLQTEKPISQLVAEEAAKIAIINGTITPGLAAQTSEYLESEDLNITLTDIADEIFENTTLIDYTGNPYTVQFLVSLMNISPTHIFHNYNPKSNIDIEITLGEDWVQSGDLP